MVMSLHLNLYAMTTAITPSEGHVQKVESEREREFPRKGSLS